MRAPGIINTSYNFRMSKVARICDKDFGHNGYGVK